MHPARVVPASLLLAAACLAAHAPARAFPLDPSVNLPVCVDNEIQLNPVIVADGQGGAFIAWEDDRITGGIYVQRVSAGGAVLWTVNGVAATSIPLGLGPALVSDGAGGVIVAWEDFRDFVTDGDIYAQRIGPNGQILWAPDGAPVCTAPDEQGPAVIASDGAGGAILAWRDMRNPDEDIYAQRINAFGTVLWAPGGVPVCTAPRNQDVPAIVPDGVGGAIVCWEDLRSTVNPGIPDTSGADVWAQRLDVAGTPQWDANGVLVIGTPRAQYGPRMVPDAAGGAIVAWTDDSLSTVALQRLDPAGVRLWNPMGIVVSPPNSDPPVLAADGEGGVVVAWSTGNLRAQKLNPLGRKMWAPAGVPLSNAVGDQSFPAIAPDGVGGAIVCWEFNDPNTPDFDIHGQRVSNAGALLWGPAATPVSSAPGDQWSPVIAANATGGLIAAWTDFREDDFGDVYAQILTSTGAPPVSAPRTVPARFALSAPRPNPMRASTELSLSLPEAARCGVDVYDLRGRRVRTLLPERELAAGPHALRWDGRDDRGAALPAGMYFVRVSGEGPGAHRGVVKLD